MQSTTWEEVKQRCAAIEAARLEPAAVFALLSHLPPLDPPSPEDGVARDGLTWEPLTADEHRKRVEANRANGATRLTEDLDIVARDMDDNMARLASALNELDAHSDIAATASVFELRAMNTRWITSAGTVDVLVSAKGPAASTINWRTLEPSAQTIKHGGQVLHIASLEDLLVMKLSVGRPRDIAVAEELAPGSSTAFAHHLAEQSGPEAPATQPDTPAP